MTAQLWGFLCTPHNRVWQLSKGTWPAVGLKSGRKVACPYGSCDSAAYSVWGDTQRKKSRRN